MPRSSPRGSGCRRCWRRLSHSLAGGLARRAAIERLVVRPLYARPLDAILATWGLGIVIGQIVTLAFGREVQFVPAPMSGTLALLGRRLFRLYRLLLVPAALIIAGAVRRAPERHSARAVDARGDHERDSRAGARHQQHAGALDHLRHRLRPRRGRRRADHAAVQRRSQHGRALAGQRLHAGDGVGRVAADARAVAASCSAARRCWSAPSSIRSSAD